MFKYEKFRKGENVYWIGLVHAQENYVNVLYWTLYQRKKSVRYFTARRTTIRCTVRSRDKYIKPNLFSGGTGLNLYSSESSYRRLTISLPSPSVPFKHTEMDPQKRIFFRHFYLFIFIFFFFWIEKELWLKKKKLMIDDHQFCNKNVA